MKKLIPIALAVAFAAGIIVFWPSETVDAKAKAKEMRYILPLPGTIYDAAGKEIPTESLRGKIVALYFSAHWCGPCRQFTPQLVKFRDKNINEGFEVVFMSLDRSAQAKADYMKEEQMKWLTAPGQSTREINHIMDFYKLRGIPSMLVFGPNGELITKDGRAEVTQNPQTALANWKARLDS